MKTKNPSRMAPAPGLLASLLLGVLAAGCSSVGYKTGDTTAISLDKASRAVQVERQALEAAIGSLAELVNAPGSDLKPQFKEYSASLERLIVSVRKTDNAIDRLRLTSAEYLEAWDAELVAMNYEIIRDSSESRRSAVSNQLEAIYRRYEETQSVVKPFISYFTDIQRSLGTDLNADGLAAAREVVRKAEENTRKVQAALDQLSLELTSSSSRLSSVTVTVPARTLAPTGQSSGSVSNQTTAELH